MKKDNLLLAHYTGRPDERCHNGSVITLKPNLRWCSDGFEFRCRNKEVVRVVFSLDCCDREVMRYAATTEASLRRCSRICRSRAWSIAPVRSPQSNGMAEASVKTFKRDYVYLNDLPDAATVMEQLPKWSEDYNATHLEDEIAVGVPQIPVSRSMMVVSGLAGATTSE